MNQYIFRLSVLSAKLKSIHDYEILKSMLMNYIHELLHNKSIKIKCNDKLKPY